MKKTLIVLLLICSCKSFCQKYVLPNEKNIISFITTKGKILTLSKDKNDEYIVYRFGTKEKIELEYPERNKESWKKFTYSFYHRGGGKMNSAMDLITVWFTIDVYEYGIFSYDRAGDEFSAESFDVGVKITNLKTNKETKIIAIENSIKGSMYQFTENGLIKIDENRID
jgi:hypothetical protein